MKRLMNVIFGVCVLGTIVANAYTGVLSLPEDNDRSKFKDNKYYISVDVASGSNGTETIFGKQRVDVIVGKLGNKATYISAGVDIDKDIIGNIGVTLMLSPDNNDQMGFGFDFKAGLQKNILGFKPYFGAKGLIANQSRDGDRVMLSYNENIVTSIVGVNVKEGRYKATMQGDVSSFILQASLGVTRNIGEHTAIFVAAQTTQAKHNFSYRVEGETVLVDTSVAQGSSGFVMGVTLKF